jgi:hypothetical protein
MSHFADGLRVGRAGIIGLDKSQRSPLSAPIAPSGALASLPGSSPGQPGVPLSVDPLFNIVPLASGAANLAASQVVSGALFTLAAGTGVTSTTRNGITVLDLGCPRCIIATGANAANAAVDLKLTGFDEYWQPMTQLFSGPAGATTVTTKKAFRYLQAASALGNTVSGVSLGTTDTIGLPHRIDGIGFFRANYNNIGITSSAGLTLADSTSPATSTTGDVRGTYALPSASDGTKQLVATILVPNTDTMDLVYGVAQV